jgi:hypothetical protein
MRVLTISDLHAPFHHAHAIDFLARLKKEIKPDAVVCMGDEIDAHGWSRHERHPDAPGQGDELKDAVKVLKQLYKLFPNVHVCRSNHGERHFKAATRCGLPSAFIKQMKEVLEAPDGWKWADHWMLDDVIYQHGEGFSGPNAALAAMRANRCSTVIGHIHSWAGIQYHSNGHNLSWGMNVGCLVDAPSLAMQYAKANPNKQVIATGAVIDGVPAIFPLEG